jgi:hypothetical protein
MTRSPPRVAICRWSTDVSPESAEIQFGTAAFADLDCTADHIGAARG